MSPKIVWERGLPLSVFRKNPTLKPGNHLINTPI